MSDEIQSNDTDSTPAPEGTAPIVEPTPAEVVTPKPAPKRAAAKKSEPAPEADRDSDDPVKAALQSLQAQHSALTVAHAAASDKAAKLAQENDSLRKKVEQFGQREREGAILSRLRDALPHASAAEIRGALLVAADEGKVDRFSATPDEAAKSALEFIKAQAQNIARAPTTAPGGGPAGAPPQPKTRGFRSPI